MRTHYQRVVCADGFTMSVQASSFSYCSPRIDNADFYSSVEVGFPSGLDSRLQEYAENPDAVLDVERGEVLTVYPYVPVSVIAAVIQSHGGQVGGELPPTQA